MLDKVTVERIVGRVVSLLGLLAGGLSAYWLLKR
jgi:hypothetical protein